MLERSAIAGRFYQPIGEEEKKEKPRPFRIGSEKSTISSKKKIKGAWIKPVSRGRNDLQTGEGCEEG